MYKKKIIFEKNVQNWMIKTNWASTKNICYKKYV